MKTESLPDGLSRLPPIVVLGDRDGEIERAAFDLLFTDVIGAAQLALTIENPMRRAVWLRGFRAYTIAAAIEKANRT